jgi:hypothetical protein
LIAESELGEGMNPLKFAVDTIICPIQVCLANKFVIVAITAAAEMKWKFGSEFEILENSLGAGENFDDVLYSERTGKSN